MRNKTRQDDDDDDIIIIIVIGAMLAGVSYLLGHWEPKKIHRRLAIQYICFFNGGRAV